MTTENRTAPRDENQGAERQQFIRERTIMKMDRITNGIGGAVNSGNAEKGTNMQNIIGLQLARKVCK